MNLRELATKIGIESYPAELEDAYLRLVDDGLAYDAERIGQLNEKYDLLGEFYEVVLAAAAEIKNDEYLKTWLALGYEFCKDVSTYEARRFPMPPMDGTLARDLFPALLLIREIPDAVKRYEKRGFTEAQIKKNLENIKINIWVYNLTRGKPALPPGLYIWLTLYTKALIVDHKGFNYQPQIWGFDSMLLKNKITGEHTFVMVSGKFHKSGLVLGSAGCTDEDGSFDAEFNEYTDMFFGHRVVNGRVQPTRERFDKSEWQAVLRPGDDIVSLHIPRNTNLSPDYVTESLKEGFALIKKLYPELSPKFIVCYSWLMHPAIVDILGPEAKLSKFMQRFTVHPLFDPTGAGCLGYVWPGEHCPPEEYSEKTSLQRGIKKRLLNGEHILAFAGVITEL